MPVASPAQLLANGISQKLVIHSPNDLTGEKSACLLKSMLLTANSDYLRLMLTIATLLSKASIPLMLDGAQDMRVTHADDDFPDGALGICQHGSVHGFPGSRAVTPRTI